MKRGFFTSNRYLNVRDILVIVGLVVVISLMVAITIPMIFANNELSSGKTLLISYITNFTLIISLLFVYRAIRTKKKPDEMALESPFKMGKFPPSLIINGIILLLSASFVVEPLTSLFPSSSEKIYSYLREAGLSGMLCSVIFAPILEELLFRGIIITDIRREYSALVAIIVSAFVFGVVHANPAQFFNAFAVGIVLGYIFLKSNSLPLVIFLHFFNNAISYVSFKLFPEEILLKGYSELISSKLIYTILYISASTILAIMVVRMTILCIYINHQRKDSLNTKIVKIESDRSEMGVKIGAIKEEIENT